MRIPLQIILRDLPAAEAVEAGIHARAMRIERICDDEINFCRVTVAHLARDPGQGLGYRVRIDLGLAGHTIVAMHDHDEDVQIALRDAFEAAERELESLIRERRGEGTRPQARQRGRILRLMRDQGYGFISSADGRELYFSRWNVVDPPFDSLLPGMDVQFLEDTGQVGPQAKRVCVGKADR